MSDSAQANPQKVAVIGSGSFGTAIALLIADKAEVLLYSRKEETAERINSERKNHGYDLPDSITATADIAQVCRECRLIFPVVPSKHMCSTMQRFAPQLTPGHILIHATKGFDLYKVSEDEMMTQDISRRNIRTMSEVIEQESAVVRIGCLSGPNLAKEIMEGQPTATVIASEFDEVIELGRHYLSGSRFYVFGSHDIVGAEMAGALKNIIAIASGLLVGKGLGKNMQGMLITRGLNEMIHLGKAMGSGYKAFLGTAGIGDLVATATSTNSRNFKFGLKLSEGKSIDEIYEETDELAEGVRTLRIAQQLIKHYDLRLPIIELLYRVIFEQSPLIESIEKVMRFPFAHDVDFLD